MSSFVMAQEKKSQSCREINIEKGFTFVDLEKAHCKCFFLSLSLTHSRVCTNQMLFASNVIKTARSLSMENAYGAASHLKVSSLVERVWWSEYAHLRMKRTESACESRNWPQFHGIWGKFFTYAPFEQILVRHQFHSEAFDGIVV